MAIETYIYCTEYTRHPRLSWEGLSPSVSRDFIPAERKRIAELVKRKQVTSAVDLITWEEYFRVIEKHNYEAPPSLSTPSPVYGFIIPYRARNEGELRRLLRTRSRTLFRKIGVASLPFITDGSRHYVPEEYAREQYTFHVLELRSLVPLSYRAFQPFTDYYHAATIVTTGPWGSFVLVSNCARPYQIVFFPEGVTIPGGEPAEISRQSGEVLLSGRPVEPEEYDRITGAASFG